MTDMTTTTAMAPAGSRALRLFLRNPNAVAGMLILAMEYYSGGSLVPQASRALRRAMGTRRSQRLRRRRAGGWCGMIKLPFRLPRVCA